MTSIAAQERAPRIAPLQGARGRPLGEALLAFVEGTHARACAVLLCLTLACALPGFVSLQPMDRDEPRFAQATKQMLETGDFVDIRFQDEARHKKPVGIHWLQSATVAAGEAFGIPEARTTIALYRLPSLAGALATVLLTYWAALAFVTRRRDAFLAAAFVAASVILIVEARLAKTDAMLAAASVAVMGALARAYFARGVASLPAATVAVFWGALAFGILIKGPMVLMFAGCCGLALSLRERSARWLLPLRPGLGLLVTLAVVVPWFVAIALKTGGAFYTAAVGDDLLGKVGTGQQNHWGPPGYYLAAFFVTFWPAAVLTAIAAPFAWRHRREDAIGFALAWAVPSWLIFEAVSTKLPHYVLPLYPALAIVTVIAMRRGEVGPWLKGATSAALLIPLVPLTVAAALAAAAWHLDGVIPLPGLAVMLAAAVVGIVAWRCFARGEVEGAALASLLASALLTAGALGLVQPNLASLKVSPRLVEVARGAPCAEPRLASVGYREPSLVFLAGTELALLPNGAEAARFLSEGGCRMAFVESRHEADFRAALAERAPGAMQPALAARVAGFNINGGRRVDLGAYLVTP